MIRLAQILLFLMPLVSFSQVDTVARLYTFGGANNDNAEEIKATAASKRTDMKNQIFR